MSKRMREGLLWLVPALVVTLYAGFILTNGSLTELFHPKAWGAFLYTNAWQHLLQGNLLIDPQFANGEYFITGPDRFVTYFGIMPALLRGAVGLFAPEVYAYSLANFSMILALLVALSSVGYAARRLAKGQRSARIIGASIVAALLVASPISYLLTWSWTYHEVILWGVAWAMLFVSVYAVWLFDHKHVTRWHGVLMGLAVGMAVLCRPTIGLTLIVPYAFLCVHAVLMLRRQNRSAFQLLWPGMIVCGLLALAVLAVNYARWGSPLTFVRITQNVQFVELFPERRAHIEAAGEFNITRLPSSLYYYLIPTSGNVTTTAPFVTIDRELAGFDAAPHYDYIEGSKVPVPLSMLYLLLVAGMGIIGLRSLKRSEKIATVWLLAGAGLTCLALLTVYAVALRYTAEFLPGVVFLGLVYVAALQRGVIAVPSRKMLALYAATGIVSAYITLATTLAYKEFVWDVPPAVRASIREFIHYSPAPHETKHIIDGKRFSIY